MQQRPMDQPNNTDFIGAKLALFLGSDLLVLRRDAQPDIPYPGFLDLPGGGREGDETPVDCVLRETHEEVGLGLQARDLIWERCYWREQKLAWFFAAHLPEARVKDIRFGDEGQGWLLMPPRGFLTHPKAVPHFQDRLHDYIEHVTAFSGPKP